MNDSVPWFGGTTINLSGTISGEEQLSLCEQISETSGKPEEAD